MFKFNQLENIHFEITNRCQASCPMCSRNYHGGVDNPLIKNQDWTINDFKKIANQEVLLQLKGFYFCGNFGDPIINDDLIDMIEYASTINPKLNIRVHTNASAINSAWWKKLARSLPPTHNVIFAIDGLEDTHSLYRIGTSYAKIIDNARSFIAAGGTAEWCFIKFKHNEHQVDEAKRRAKEIGFNLFTVKNSSRFIGSPKFEVLDNGGNITRYLEPPTNSKVDYISDDVVKNYKEVLASAEIDCYVKHSKEVYIDAYKNLFPCCFLASAPYNYSKSTDLIAPIRNEILNQYHDLVNTLGGIDRLNLINNELKSVVESEEWQTAWEHYWNSNKLITCARTCGKLKNISIPKPKDQFIEHTGL